MIQSGSPSLTVETVDLSVVFITYNRSKLLARSVESLRGALNSVGYSYELIIADDCSTSEHKDRIDRISAARVARTTSNSGLGANVNNGIAHSRGRLILQLQDDWNWVGESEVLAAALDFVDSSPDVGIVQLTRVGTDLPVSFRNNNGVVFKIFKNDHIPWIRSCGVRPYSDQPHIKRREFIDDIGAYLDGVPMTRCENEFKHRVANQRRWHVAMLAESPCFVHTGAETSLNPGGRRHVLVQMLHLLPWGKTYADPCFRQLARWADHIAARLMANL